MTREAGQREAVVSEVVTRVCHGKDYDRLAEGYYPTVPGNPPEWVDNWEVFKVSTAARVVCRAACAAACRGPAALPAGDTVYRGAVMATVIEPVRNARA